MRSAFAVAAFIVFSVFPAMPGFAEPTIKARLSQDKATPSEIVFFYIEAEWPRGEAQYQFAIPDFQLENLAILDQGQSQETYPGQGGEWTRKVFSFQLKANKAGTAKIQAFNLPYIDPSLQKGGTHKIEALTLRVDKSGVPKWIWLMTCVILFAPPAVILWLLNRKKTQPMKQPPVSPAKESAERFRELLEQQVAYNDTVLPELNQHLRSFLIQTYRIPESYATESEIARSLESAALPKEELTVLKNILTELEEIKYLGKPTEAEYSRLRNDLLRFIHSKQVSSI
jgi:hypothetical protein